jgi:hypothetical protein
MKERVCGFLFFKTKLCARKIFLWHCNEPKGQSSGILLGIDLDVYDIGAIDKGDYYVKFYLCNKTDYFKWALVAIYGPTQIHSKEQFLTEMVHMCSHEQLSILLGEILIFYDTRVKRTRTISRIDGHFYSTVL